MRKPLQPFIGSALVALTLLGSAYAKDWPHWRGPQGDGISQETGLLKAWPSSGPKILWEAPLGAGFSSFAVVEGRVLTQYQTEEGEFLAAFDEPTGKPLWKLRTGDPYIDRQGFHGPRATPTVEDGKVYALDAIGNLVCAEAASGKVIWQKNVLKELGGQNTTWGLAQSPFIDGPLLYIMAGLSKGNSVAALDKKSGNVVWKALDDLAGYATPVKAVIGGMPQIIFFTGSEIVALTPKDGKKLWSVPWKTMYDINAAMPIVRGDKVFISSGYNTGCALIQVDPKATPAVKEIYKNKNMRCKFQTPALLGDYVYGADDNQLRCIKFDTGEVQWTQQGFEMASIMMADGLATIQGQKGNLALAKLTPEKFEKISEFDGLIKGGHCWTPPVVANGKLFIRDVTKMFCLDIKER